MPSPCPCLLQNLVVVGLFELLGLRLKSPIWTIEVTFGKSEPGFELRGFVLGEVRFRGVKPPRD